MSEFPDALRAEMRRFASATYTPILAEPTERLLCRVLDELKPSSILEIGTAIGYSAIVMLGTLPTARLTTLEIRRCRYAQARLYLARAGYEDRARVLCEDADTYLTRAAERFDFIFLDGPKARYAGYLSRLAAKLAPGGAIFADNLAFGGRTAAARAGGLRAIPRKHRAAVKSLIAYGDAIGREPFVSDFYDVGDGIALTRLSRAAAVRAEIGRSPVSAGAG